MTVLWRAFQTVCVPNSLQAFCVFLPCCVTVNPPSSGSIVFHQSVWFPVRRCVCLLFPKLLCFHRKRQMLSRASGVGPLWTPLKTCPAHCAKTDSKYGYLNLELDITSWRKKFFRLTPECFPKWLQARFCVFGLNGLSKDTSIVWKAFFPQILGGWLIHKGNFCKWGNPCGISAAPSRINTVGSSLCGMQDALWLVSRVYKILCYLWNVVVGNLHCNSWNIIPSEKISGMPHCISVRRLISDTLKL